MFKYNNDEMSTNNYHNLQISYLEENKTMRENIQSR